MNKVLEYFNRLNNNEEILKKKITVAGWQFNYEHLLISGITPYLFEELEIIEHIAKEKNENRDLRIKPKVYITVHDTGDTLKTHNAKFWSNAVYKELLPDAKTKYAASFQYVVGNDGIYHNIPDNEVAYHAGDTTQFDYNLYNSGVKAADKCILSIDKDGYYTINDERTLIKAPLFEKEIDGKLVTRICTIDDINDQGICMALDDEYFYIGETYFNKTYEKIANRGGNNNSIGIETCVNEGSNIHLSMQRCAKLVAKLLDENNLDISDIKQHHFFSGKNCPQTFRINDLWEYYLHLVEIECEVREFIKEGYSIKLIPHSEYLEPNGILTKLPKSVKGIKYTIETTKDGVVDSLSYFKLL